MSRFFTIGLATILGGCATQMTLPSSHVAVEMPALQAVAREHSFIPTQWGVVELSDLDTTFGGARLVVLDVRFPNSLPPNDPLTVLHEIDSGMAVRLFKTDFHFLPEEKEDVSLNGHSGQLIKYVGTGPDGYRRVYHVRSHVIGSEWILICAVYESSDRWWLSSDSPRHVERIRRFLHSVTLH